MTSLTKGMPPARAGIPAEAQAIGYGAVLPLVAGAAAIWLATTPAMVEAVLGMLRAYGALALAFLGGVRWGLAVGRDTRDDRLPQFVLSSMPPAVGWLALLPGPVVGLGLLICGLAVQCLWDVLSTGRGEMPGWYAGLRLRITAVAVACLVAALVRLIVA